MGKSLVVVKCCVCGLKIERYASEVKRNAKLKRKICCSLKCVGKKFAKKNLKCVKSRKWDHLQNFQRKQDEYSPFRYCMKLIRMHTKNKIGERCKIDIGLEDLKQQWDKQGGICPYTGWKIRLVNHGHKEERTPDRASLDRIDSSKGYTKDNIQFVSLIVQYAKSTWNDYVILELAKAVCNHTKRQKFDCS